MGRNEITLYSQNRASHTNSPSKEVVVNFYSSDRGIGHFSSEHCLFYATPLESLRR